MLTGGTLGQPAAHRPRLAVSEPRTPKSLRPPESGQIRATGGLGREARLELNEIPRIILHGGGRYMLGSPEQVNSQLD